MAKTEYTKDFIGDTFDMRGEVGQVPTPAQDQQGRSHPWKHLRSDPMECVEPEDKGEYK